MDPHLLWRWEPRLSNRLRVAESLTREEMNRIHSLESEWELHERMIWVPSRLGVQASASRSALEALEWRWQQWTLGFLGGDLDKMWCAPDLFGNQSLLQTLLDIDDSRPFGGPTLENGPIWCPHVRCTYPLLWTYLYSSQHPDQCLVDNICLFSICCLDFFFKKSYLLVCRSFGSFIMKHYTKEMNHFFCGQAILP